MDIKPYGMLQGKSANSSKIKFQIIDYRPQTAMPPLSRIIQSRCNTFAAECRISHRTRLLIKFTQARLLGKSRHCPLWFAYTPTLVWLNCIHYVRGPTSWDSPKGTLRGQSGRKHWSGDKWVSSGPIPWRGNKDKFKESQTKKYNLKLN